MMILPIDSILEGRVIDIKALQDENAPPPEV